MGLPPAPPQPTRPPRPADPRTHTLRTTFTDNSTQDLTPVARDLEEAPAPISAPLPPPPAADPRATGPVDFLPDPPAPEATAPGAAGQRAPRRPSRRLPVAALGLTAAAIGLLEAGLLDGGAGGSLWSTVPLWSGFATAAAVLGLLVGLTRGRGLRDDGAWKVSAAGLTGVAAFWVLVVLPMADTDRGFVLTAALACLGLALWVTPGRRS